MATWPVSSAKTRLSVIETLTRVVPVVVSDHKGAPDPAVLRSALRKTLNPGGHTGEPDEDETKALMEAIIWEIVQFQEGVK